MVAQARMNVHQTMGRRNNCELNFFSMYLVQNNEQIHFYSENSEIYNYVLIRPRYSSSNKFLSLTPLLLS